MSEEKVNHCRVIYYCGGIVGCKFALPLAGAGCRFFEGPCCTSSRAAAAAVRVEAELVTNTDGTDRTDKFVPADKKCLNCKGTGWYGDNGPGRRGNSELAPCECTRMKVDEMDLMDDMDGRKL